jgi:anti-sigma-K factor RskA
MADGIHELTAGYALDALDDDERRAYEEHLEDCEQCRAELASFGAVAGALALAASGPEPPAGLRDRVLTAARAEPQNVVPLAEPQNVVPLAARQRRSLLTPAFAAAAAVAAAVAIGLGIYAATLKGDLDDARTALSSPPSVVPIEGADGRLVVTGDGKAWLALSDLPDAPVGKTYEVWVIEGNTPRSAGLFAGAPSPTLVRVERNVPDDAVVAVTLERAGGVSSPTTTPVVVSQPV